MEPPHYAQYDTPAPQPEELTPQILEQLLGMKVVNFDLYVTAFTHKSAASELGVQSSERLEFLGDSVLGFATATHLCRKYPDAAEGFLTRIRTKLVSGEILAVLARQLGLHRYIRMNARAMRHGYNHNPKLLEDTLEALVGALYMDLGLCAAKTWFLSLLERSVQYDQIEKDTNYKDTLMKYAQRVHKTLPVYEVLNDPHQTHKPVFDVAVSILDRPCGRGQGASKRAAEQAAALNALHSLGIPLG